MLKRRFLAPAVAMLSLTAPAVEAINVPRQSPELAINLGSGKQVLLSQYQGKVVVMAFILTWCPHCQKTIGYLSKDQNDVWPARFAGAGFGHRRRCPGQLAGFHPAIQSAVSRGIRQSDSGHQLAGTSAHADSAHADPGVYRPPGRDPRRNTKATTNSSPKTGRRRT